MVPIYLLAILHTFELLGEQKPRNEWWEFFQSCGARLEPLECRLFLTSNSSVIKPLHHHVPGSVINLVKSSNYEYEFIYLLIYKPAKAGFDYLFVCLFVFSWLLSTAWTSPWSLLGKIFWECFAIVFLLGMRVGFVPKGLKLIVSRFLPWCLKPNWHLVLIIYYQIHFYMPAKEFVGC